MHRYSALRLYQIASVCTVTKTCAEKRRAILIDLAIGLGIPLLQIPLQYPVQVHRYDIFEDIGCLGETYETAPAVVLFHLPPILIDAVSDVYCASNLSTTPAPNFASSSPPPRTPTSINRYIRLMALAFTGLLLTVPLASFVLYSNVSVTWVSPWVSWADTHSNLSRVVQVPGLARGPIEHGERGDTAVGDELSGAFNSVAKRMGYTTAGSASGISSTAPLLLPWLLARRSATLPVFIRTDTTQKCDSFDSFSDMSASYGGISLLEYDAEKAALEHEGAGGEKGLTLTLGDVSGMLPDYRESDYSSSSAPSSASSDTESVGGEEEAEIEVSSLHLASVHVPTPPEPAHTRPASVRDTGDTV
ncbi:pheromone A receptor-domain-containing protein [Mycena leptocephala]|nr:pheromone A receptor-domain-containing protein [Mycena leptocephala]